MRASTIPRPGGRGERILQDTPHISSIPASTIPRPGGRGEMSRRRWSRRSISCFNDTPARRPGRGPARRPGSLYREQASTIPRPGGRGEGRRRLDDRLHAGPASTIPRPGGRGEARQRAPPADHLRHASTIPRPGGRGEPAANRDASPLQQCFNDTPARRSGRGAESNPPPRRPPPRPMRAVPAARVPTPRHGPGPAGRTAKFPAIPGGWPDSSGPGRFRAAGPLDSPRRRPPLAAPRRHAGAARRSSLLLPAQPTRVR